MSAKRGPPPTGAAAQPASSRTARTLNAVGFSEQRERVRFLGPAFRAGFLHALYDMPAGDRAVGAHVIRPRIKSFGHLPEHRPADLHRVGEIFRLHAPRAVVPGTALHRVHGGARD